MNDRWENDDRARRHGDCPKGHPDGWHWCVAGYGHVGPHVFRLESRAWYDTHGYLGDKRLDGIATAETPSLASAGGWIAEGAITDGC